MDEYDVLWNKRTNEQDLYHNHMYFGTINKLNEFQANRYVKLKKETLLFVIKVLDGEFK